jgi:hypothetical protein
MVEGKVYVRLMGVPILLIVLATFVLSTTGFAVAVVWEAVNLHLDRQALRHALRMVEDTSRARKEKPSEPIPRSDLWDRELDG